MQAVTKDGTASAQIAESRAPRGAALRSWTSAPNVPLCMASELLSSRTLRGRRGRPRGDVFCNCARRSASLSRHAGRFAGTHCLRHESARPRIRARPTADLGCQAKGADRNRSRGRVALDRAAVTQKLQFWRSHWLRDGDAAVQLECFFVSTVFGGFSWCVRCSWDAAGAASGPLVPLAVQVLGHKFPYQPVFGHGVVVDVKQ